MFDRLKLVPLLALLGAMTVAACSEKLESSENCPVLCPQDPVLLRDTVLEASLVVDSSLGGFPPLGREPFLILSQRLDTLETRVIFRFDSLPSTFRGNASTFDSTIVRVDTAYLAIPLVVADTLVRPKVPFTVEAYDVTAAANDTGTVDLAAQFRPENLIGTIEVTNPDTLTSSLRVPVSTDRVLQRVLDKQPLRIGLRLRADSSVQIRFMSADSPTAAGLFMFVSGDPQVPPVRVALRSRTPDEAAVRFALYDFTIVSADRPIPPGTIRLGGVPWHRAYYRFDLPASIVDTASVVRATLILTQRPNRGGARAGDSIIVVAVPILSSGVVTDVRSALDFAASLGSFPIDQIRIAPRDSGAREMELVALFRFWRARPDSIAPRAFALRTDSEALAVGEIHLFSNEAPLAVRPRLRITYAGRLGTGLP